MRNRAEQHGGAGRAFLGPFRYPYGYRSQEESLSCSENVKWRVRKDFREGKVNGMTMLGYHLVDGVLTIMPEEAELVQQIFADYMSGIGFDSCPFSNEDAEKFNVPLKFGFFVATCESD